MISIHWSCSPILIFFRELQRFFSFILSVRSFSAAVRLRILRSFSGWFCTVLFDTSLTGSAYVSFSSLAVKLGFSSRQSLLVYLCSWKSLLAPRQVLWARTWFGGRWHIAARSRDCLHISDIVTFLPLGPEYDPLLQWVVWDHTGYKDKVCRLAIIRLGKQGNKLYVHPPSSLTKEELRVWASRE